MAHIVRRPGDEVFILQNQAQPFPPIHIRHSAFLPADTGAFPPRMSSSSNWREDEIQYILAGDTGVEKYKKLLLKFGLLGSTTITDITSCPSMPTLHRRFFSNDNINPADIIPALCDESMRLFRQIPFHSWVRSALGLEDETLGFFKRFHETLNHHILTYQEHHRNELLVPHCVSEEQNPFIHAAVTSWLCENQWPILLAFIIHPLSTILYNNRLALWQVLLCLEILEIRYHRLYRDQFSIDFKSSFPVEIQLFPAIVGNKQPYDLACQLTSDDLGLFHSLSPKSIIFKDNNFCLIDNIWQSRTEEARILATLCQDYIVNLTMEFVNLRNYNAATALLEGLRTVEDLPASTRSLLPLIQPDNNYGHCRKEMSRKKPAIPFLRPLVTCYEHNGVKALYLIFQHCAYELSTTKNQRSPKSLRGLYPLSSKVDLMFALRSMGLHN